MRKLFLFFSLIFLFHSEVVFAGTVTIGTCSASSGLNGTAVNVTTGTVTTGSSNPAIYFTVGMTSTSRSVASIGGNASFATTTVTKLTRSAVSNGANEVWVAVAPPASTSGTFTIYFDASAAYQYAWCPFTGVHQTTPTPSSDIAVDSSTGTNPITLTAPNLTASDMSYGSFTNVQSGTLTSITPTQNYLDNTTTINYAAGSATGTASMTFTRSNTLQSQRIDVRIQAASGGGGGGGGSPNTTPCSEVICGDDDP